MPKGSPELTNARREEIISACETLYQTMGFKEVTIKEIARYTSFQGLPSIITSRPRRRSFSLSFRESTGDGQRSWRTSRKKVKL